MTAFRFTTDPPFKRVAKALGDAGKELTDWRPAWRAFLPLIGPELAASFRSRGAAMGQGWPELSKRWAERKARMGRSRALGVFTGGLEAELAAGNGRKSITKKRLRYGPKDRTAYIFHHGREGQPAREFLGFTPRLEESLTRILTSRADEVMARAVAAMEGRTGG